MATSNPLQPSEDHTKFFRVQCLLVDGGTWVMKNQFDSFHPLRSLRQALQTCKPVIDNLNANGIITLPQYALLFPASGRPKSSNFDITLLACLLQNMCGFKKDPVWKLPSPHPLNLTLPADVMRLRNLRNKVCHLGRSELDDAEFNSLWNEIEAILLRQGKKIGNLPTLINDLKTANLDVALSKKQDTIIKEWERLGGYHEKTFWEIDVELENIKENNKSVIDFIKVNSDTSRDYLLDIKCSINELEISLQFKQLLWRSKQFLEDKQIGDVYVKTNLHFEASAKLEINRYLVLCGEHGDGKTTMAVQLLLDEFQIDRCLKLTKPSDWNDVNLSAGLFDSILIDDIFGCNVLDESFFISWRNLLPEIRKLSKKYGFAIIITTRPYILEEIKLKYKPTTMYSENDIVKIMSHKIVSSDRRSILRAHLKKEQRSVSGNVISRCIDQSLMGTDCDSATDVKPLGLLFGFPECVALFTQYDNLFDKGPTFFAKPLSFFFEFIADLMEDENKKMALTFLWVNNAKSITLKTFDVAKVDTCTSFSEIADGFLFSGSKAEICQGILHSLQTMKSSVVHFSTTYGTFSFKHRIMYDAVGLNINRDPTKKRQLIKYCSRDFLMKYVAMHADENDEYHCCISQFMIQDMTKRVSELMFVADKRRKNGTEMIDTRILHHPVFEDKTFIREFLKYITSYNISLSKTSVFTVFNYKCALGIHIRCIDIRLLSYCVYRNQNEAFVKQAICATQMKSKENTDAFQRDLALCLLFAIDRKDTPFVDFLCQQNVMVSSVAIYLALHLGDVNCLHSLLKCNNARLDDSTDIPGENKCLIIAARKGMVEEVRVLLKHGANVNARNKNGTTALYKAVNYKHFEICEVLIENGADVNTLNGSFGRSPLHLAADLGCMERMRYILVKGVNVRKKDKRGHSAIHCAAMQGHDGIVKLLLEHDKSLATFRATSYGKQSCMKGFTIFHIAAWKNNLEIVKHLIACGEDINVKDSFGRTPLYIASFYGYLQIVKALIPVADLNMGTKYELTPLHAAVCGNNYHIVALLCPLVDVNRVNKKGQTALHLACKSRPSLSIVEKLITSNTDWTLTTKNGSTVFQNKAMKKYTRYRNEETIEHMKKLIDLSTVEEIPATSNKRHFSNTLATVISSTDPKFREKLRQLHGPSEVEYEVVMLFIQHFVCACVALLVVCLASDSVHVFPKVLEIGVAVIAILINSYFVSEFFK